MLPWYAYYLLLAAVCGFAFVAGRRDERAVAAVCLLASLATSLWSMFYGRRFRGLETGTLLIDLAALVIFTLVALRSERFWPLWVAGLQLTTTFGHAIKAINADLVPVAYAAASRFWVYPILLVLLVGTLRTSLGERLARARIAGGEATRGMR